MEFAYDEIRRISEATYQLSPIELSWDSIYRRRGWMTPRIEKRYACQHGELGSRTEVQIGSFQIGWFCVQHDLHTTPAR